MLLNLLIFLAVLSSTGLLLAMAISLLMARAILCPPRMTDGKAVYRLHRLSPGDLGLVFDNLWFTVKQRTGRDLKIASWWIPAGSPTNRCAVLIHGFAGAKVASIAWAPILHDAGLNILAIDLRAHGESDGIFCTGGFFEQDDVNDVIDQLRNLRPSDAEQLMLFGVSLGAGIAAAVAAGRNDIAAVVLESPFTTYRRAIAAHTELTGMPGGLIMLAAIECAQWFSGANFDAVRPVDTIPRIGCPLLTIIGVQDELLDDQDISKLRAAVESQPQGRLWLVEGSEHMMASHTHPLEYRRRIEELLTKALPVRQINTKSRNVL
jgi:pimeloyl-ACP methyl ester carboxylesterase